MAMTNAERQKRYRDKALDGIEGLNMKRLQMIIDVHASYCLDRMARGTGRTKRELVEEAIIKLADELGYRHGD